MKCHAAFLINLRVFQRIQRVTPRPFARAAVWSGRGGAGGTGLRRRAAAARTLRACKARSARAIMPLRYAEAVSCFISRTGGGLGARERRSRRALQLLVHKPHTEEEARGGSLMMMTSVLDFIKRHTITRTVAASGCGRGCKRSPLDPLGAAPACRSLPPCRHAGPQ